MFSFPVHKMLSPNGAEKLKYGAEKKVREITEVENTVTT